MDYRIEKDLLGERNIPVDSYWGIHTQRAMENFSLSGYTADPSLLRSLAQVKKACVATNTELGFIPREKAEAILKACDEIIQGKHVHCFPVDALQGGAGTSTNMNMNEVIANRALEIMGIQKGEYSQIHPLETVNLHQSTNDVYPTAIKVAVLYALKGLSQGIEAVQSAFQKKEDEFKDVVKAARTQMQPAVPMTLGLQFSSFAEAFARDRWRVSKCEERLRVVNLGGTAIGTGLCAPREYIFLVVERLRSITGLNLSRAENSVDQTANSDSFVEVSGILKVHAQNLIKVANDLRLLQLLEEIEIPKAQVGSSIMPGKTNPVLLEAVVQAGIKVVANDMIVTECASRGSLQINEFLPLLAHALLETIRILAAANTIFAGFIPGIQADPARCQEILEQSSSLITAFVPMLGYAKAEQLACSFAGSGKRTLKEFLVEHLGKECVEKVLAAQHVRSLGFVK